MDHPDCRTGCSWYATTGRPECPPGECVQKHGTDWRRSHHPAESPPSHRPMGGIGIHFAHAMRQQTVRMDGDSAWGSESEQASEDDWLIREISAVTHRRQEHHLIHDTGKPPAVCDCGTDEYCNYCRTPNRYSFRYDGTVFAVPSSYSAQVTGPASDTDRPDTGYLR